MLPHQRPELVEHGAFIDIRAGTGDSDLQKHIDTIGCGHIASIIGRFYAMDRDKRWDRIKVAYDQLVEGKGRQVADMVQGVQSCYDSHTEEHKNTDEFMEPLVNSTVDGRIKEGDVVIFFNYRNDRAKELTVVLTQQDMTEQGMKTIKDLQYYCMTPYDASFKGVHILFPKENVENTLGEYISSKGLKQLHTAETEKYAHVTFFFNGGREAPYEGEDRILVNSPKVATYDLKPEMSAFEVKDKLVEKITLTVSLESLTPTLVQDLAEVVQECPGEAELYFNVHSTADNMSTRLFSRKTKISVQKPLIHFFDAHSEIEISVNT